MMRVKSSKGVFVSVCDGCGQKADGFDPPWRFLDAPMVVPVGSEHEYSESRKRWKRDVNAFCKLDPERIDPFTGAQLGWPAEWWMGEYVPDSDPKLVGIVWRPIVVVGGAA